MRRSWASNASNDLPNATNIKPSRLASAHGIDRRTTNAGGSKLSCSVRFTWAEIGAESSSSLSLNRRPIILSRSVCVIASNRSRLCTHCWVATKLEPSAAIGVPYDRRRNRGISLWIFGAVFVAGQIESVVKLKTVDDPITAKCRTHQPAIRARQMNDAPAIVATDPEPEIRLGRRHFTAGRAQVGKRSELCHRLSQRFDQSRTDTDDNILSDILRSQIVQGRQRIGFRCQAKLHIAGLLGTGARMPGWAARTDYSAARAVDGRAVVQAGRARSARSSFLAASVISMTGGRTGPPAMPISSCQYFISAMRHAAGQPIAHDPFRVDLADGLQAGGDAWSLRRCRRRAHARYSP